LKHFVPWGPDLFFPPLPYEITFACFQGDVFLVGDPCVRFVLTGHDLYPATKTFSGFPPLPFGQEECYAILPSKSLFFFVSFPSLRRSPTLAPCLTVFVPLFFPFLFFHDPFVALSLSRAKFLLARTAGFFSAHPIWEGFSRQIGHPPELPSRPPA